MVIFLACIPLLVLIRGVVLSHLRSWFIVPLGAPNVGVTWAIGIAATVSVFHSSGGPWHQSRGNEDLPSPAAMRLFHRQLRQLALAGLGAPVGVLALGWVVKQFMVA